MVQIGGVELLGKGKSGLGGPLDLFGKFTLYEKLMARLRVLKRP